MLPILLVISFVAPQAWSTQATTAATAAPVAIAAVPAVTATTAPEVVPVEQARPSTRAREAARAQAETELELVARVQSALLEQASAERAKVREVMEAAQARRATRAREVEREVTRALEATEQSQEIRERNVRRRAELEKALGTQETAMLESQLREMEMTVRRQRELADKGLASRNDLVATEQQLHQMRMHLERAKIQHEMTTHDLQSRREQAELQRGADRELERIGLGTTHRNLDMLDESARLQPRDHLTIAIAGEPDLPTEFMVREDGSIRFPFLGSIRVQGSTTSQVQAAIQKLISDKSLARNPQVTVSAGRSR